MSSSFVYCTEPLEYEHVVEDLWPSHRLALDIETYGPPPYADEKNVALDPHRGRISLIQLKSDTSPIYILDWLVLREQVDLSLLLSLLDKVEYVVIHNASFELRFFLTDLGYLIKNARCTLVAAQLLSNATGSKLHRQCGHRLDDLVRDYFGAVVEGKGTLQVSSWRARPLSSEKLHYAAVDVEWLLPLWDLLFTTLTNPLPDGPFHPRTPEQWDLPAGLGMQQSLDIEMSALIAFAKMQLAGMPASSALLEYYYTHVHSQTMAAALKASQLLKLPQEPPDLFTGEQQVSAAAMTVLNSHEQLTKLLRQYTSLKTIDNVQARTVARLLMLFKEQEELGSPNFVGDEREHYQQIELLEESAREANKELLQALIQYKRYKKAEDIDLREYVNPLTGCIHPNLQQVGTSTSRSSCSSPNLQQINAKATVDIEFGQYLQLIGREPTHTELDKALFSFSQRECFVAPPGYVICSCDYSSQELLVMAALSQDATMLRAFTAPKTIVVDGVEYPNPDADLHIQNAANCCYPHLFADQPYHLWDTIARDKALTGTGVSARHRGKTLSYGTAYMQGAKTMAEQNFVEVAEAELWLQNHKKAYQKFHRWSDRLGAIGSAQGWLANKIGTIRYVDEDNAKGSGESPARSAVNFAIQGLCASIGKIMLARLSPVVEDLGGKILCFIHDEVVVLLPGDVTLVTDKCRVKDNHVVPYWLPTETVRQSVDKIIEIMTTAETEVLDGVLTGEASSAVAPYWLH